MSASTTARDQRTQPCNPQPLQPHRAGTLGLCTPTGLPVCCATRTTDRLLIRHLAVARSSLRCTAACSPPPRHATRTFLVSKPSRDCHPRSAGSTRWSVISQTFKRGDATRAREFLQSFRLHAPQLSFSTTPRCVSSLTSKFSALPGHVFAHSRWGRQPI